MDDNITLPLANNAAANSRGGSHVPHVGEEIDDFTIVDVLGWGRCSVVYRIMDNTAKTSRALKMLSPDAAKSEEQRQRFSCEIEIMGSLSHPNIVRLHGHGIYGNCPYLTMEYIRGVNLEEHAIASGRPGVELALSIASDTAAALAHVHERGFVHRDVKLKNIMLDCGAWRPVLMDFGIARAVDWDVNLSLTRDDQVLGTPFYMAPELFESATAATSSSDIYAFGASMYQFLTGGAPFAGGSVREISARHRDERPASIRLRHPDCPPELDHLIVDACLAKTPSRRPRSMAEVVDALERIRNTAILPGDDSSDRGLLLVDDEANVINSLRRLLQKEPYTVYTAASADEAMGVLESQKVQIVLTDNLMPGETGVEMAGKIAIRWPEKIVMILSGHSDTAAVIDAINRGRAHKFLTKPWNNDEIKQNIRLAFEQFELRGNNRKLAAVVQERNEELRDANENLHLKVAAQTAELAERNQRLRQTLRDAVALLGGVMESHYPGSRGHGRRVAAMAVRLATAIGLDEDEVTAVEVAAALHDVGKISIPPQVLAKPRASYTHADFTAFNRHSLVGHAILKEVPSFSKAAEFVLYHHERYGGGGYPESRRGAAIPLGARVVALANCYDNILNPPGGAAVSRDAAEKELTQMAGEYVDPELVSIFLEKKASAAADNGDEMELSIDSLRPGMVLARDVRAINNAVLIAAGNVVTGKIIENLQRNELFDPYLSRLVVHRWPASESESELPDNEETPSAPTANDQNGREDEKLKSGGSPLIKARRPDRIRYPQAAGTTDKPMVVVIDDDSGVVNALRRELRLAGYQVEGFVNPLKAVEFIKSSPTVFALITDFNMPGIKGDELIARIQEVKPDMPCLAITAQATRENVAKLANAGRLERIFTKPWNSAELAAVLDKIRERIGGNSCPP